jgi:hypothetical protein
MSAELEQLHGWLARAIGAAFCEALAVSEPAGSSPAWARTCAEHGVAAISEQARVEVRRAQRPLRGAPVMELAQVVTAIVRAARAHLEHVLVSGPAETSRRDKLKRLLDRADREVIEAYKRVVLPRRAGMFANVLAHHGGAPAAAAPSAEVLLCQTCGGPRLGERDLECAFCGNHMAAGL